jgi:outer membrane protein
MGKLLKIKVLIIFCWTLLMFQISWAEASILSLKEAIFLALRYSPNIQSAELQRIIDKYGLRLAQNAFEVQYALNGSASYTRNRAAGTTGSNLTTSLTPQASILTPLGTQVTTSYTDNRNYTTFNPGVTVSIAQPLWRGAGSDIVQAPLHNAEDQELINRLNLKGQLIDTVTSVIIAYRSYVSALNNLNTAQITLKGYAETVKQTEAMIIAGRLAPSELVQVQAQAANQQVSLQQAQNSVEQARLNLLSVLGMDPATAMMVDNNIELSAFASFNQQHCINMALENNITYQTALNSLQISKRNLLLAKDALKPQLNANLSSTFGQGSGKGENAGFESISNNKNYNHVVGLTLNVPIDNVQLKYNEVQTRIGLKQQEIRLQALKIQIINDVMASLRAIETDVSNIKQAQRAQQLAKQTLDIAKAKLRYGRMSTFELVNMEQAYNASSLQMTASQVAYLNDLASFDQKLGNTLQTWGIQIRD